MRGGKVSVKLSQADGAAAVSPGDPEETFNLRPELKSSVFLQSLLSSVFNLLRMQSMFLVWH